MNLRQRITELQDVLGQRMVAYAVGTRSCRRVGRWATGVEEPAPYQAVCAQHLYDVVQALREESNETIRALMMGSWPELDDRAPLEVIRDGYGERMTLLAKDWAARQ